MTPAQTELLLAAKVGLQALGMQTFLGPKEVLAESRLRSAIAACEQEEAGGKTEPLCLRCGEPEGDTHEFGFRDHAFRHPDKCPGCGFLPCECFERDPAEPSRPPSRRRGNPMAEAFFRAKVKPLVWKRFRKNGFRSTTTVVSPSKLWTNYYLVGDSLSGRTTNWFWWFDGKTERRAKTKELAMSYCQRDHEARVRALLQIEE